MATLARHTYLSALDDNQRRSGARHLQATLVELIQLSLLGKHLHWNISGTSFKMLHEFLDDLVDSWHNLADSVAERSIALGISADGRPSALVAESIIDPVEAGFLECHQALCVVVSRLEAVVARVRGRIRELDVDPASQDVIVDVVRDLEKQLWMLRASLPAGEE